MLAALLLAGLAAAAIVPIAYDHLFDDTDDADGQDDAPDGKSSPDGDMLAPSEDAGIAAPEGTHHDIPAMSGDTVLAAFDPGCDRCTLTIDTWDSEIVLTDDGGDDGVSLSFTNAADEIVTLRFPGLSEVPVDAITLCVDAAGEGGPVTIPLSGVFSATDEADDGVDDADRQGAALSPVDPDAPDDLPHPRADAVPLGPVDPDMPGPLPAVPWDGDALVPVVEDDPAQTQSLIWGDPDTGAPLPALVDGFDSGDLLSITLSPAAFPGPLEVSVTADGTGEATLVLVDGQPVAVVTGPVAPVAAQVHVSLAGNISP